MSEVKIKQFKNNNGEPVAGLTPEYAVYDKNTGKRLDSKLGEMSSQITELEHDVLGKEKNYKEGFRIVSGYEDEAADAEWFVTNDYIPVSFGDTVVWNPGLVKSGASIAIYNANKEWIYYRTANATTRTIPLNTSGDSGAAYVRASFAIANKANAKIIVNGSVVWTPQEDVRGLAQDVEDIAANVDDLVVREENAASKITINDRYINAADGGLLSSANHKVSDFIRVFSGDLIKYSLRGSNATVALVAFYSSKNVSSFVSCTKANASASIVNGFFECPTDGFIRFTNRKDYPDGYAYIINKQVGQLVKASIEKDYSNDIDAMLRPYQSNNPSSFKPLALVHFSDIHGNDASLRRIKAFQTKYADKIANVICSGDMVNGKFSDDFTYWAGNGCSDFLVAIGNHDSALGTDTILGDQATEAQCFSKYLASVASWGVTYSANHCYYYKDYPTIRLVVLDVMHYTDAQHSWLVSTLNTAKTSGLAVVICAHFRAGDVNGESTFNSYLTDLAYGTLDSRVLDAVDTFQNGGGEFICYMNGHTHIDVFGAVVGHPNQVSITIGNASFSAAQSSYGDLERRTDDFSQDLFNVIAFDTNAKLIKVLRVGADRSSFMQHRGVLCYNYNTHKLIAND